ncbi:hypothetical protein MGMO_62c00170 [Methyloglobulus morosus KoM1]|uniref:Lipoprotein n=1 Tax=Methyloglobulus morosus KoM1 TaxID=1116472 RepID=V5BWP8_9GAMM|nr:DUF4410 domain-containing protein [Methyloglobulus morosus]ESS72284.1 hypothetical protein MGMO_62c00170 [Methyloglobulus morosus KoM1]
MDIMKVDKVLVLVIFACSLVACSSKTVLKTPETSLRSIGETVRVNITGQNIAKSALDQLTREIKGQLIIAGFDLPEEANPKTLNLDVNVTEFDPGNAALRLTVGFGAGRGSLLYLAEYKNQGGKILASMNGEERFTGLEPGFNQNYGAFATLGGEETATTVLIKEAAKHIIELALNPKQK